MYVLKKRYSIRLTCIIVFLLLPGSCFLTPIVAGSDNAWQEAFSLYHEGGYYSGEWEKGMRHGSGTMIYPDGSEYSGSWKHNMRHGKGTCILSDGSMYNGLFYDDKPHGKGIYEYPDGIVRSAVFESGKIIESVRLPFAKKAGECRYGVFYRDGKYTGWFKGSYSIGFRPHGRGKMEWANGCLYAGQWNDGKMHGRGIMRWEDGSVYMGQWEQGKRTGCGVYHWASGSKYIGQWKNNQRHGAGISFSASGGALQGIFSEDRYIGQK